IGPATPLSRAVYRLPVYGQFRAWGRYIYGLDLAVAMLGAYGVQMLRRGARPERRAAAVLAVAAGAAAVALAVWLPRLGGVRRLIPGGTPAAASLLVPCAFALGAV